MNGEAADRGTGNPFESPAVDAIRTVICEGQELPFGRVLLGILAIPPISGLAQLAIAPAWTASLRFFYASLPPIDLRAEVEGCLAAAAMATGTAGISLLLGGPILLFYLTRDKLTPKRVQLVGVAIAAITWVVYAANDLYAWAGVFTFDLATTRSWGPLVVYLIATSLVMPALPVFLGFAAYAWWIKRLQQKPTKEHAAAANDQDSATPQHA